MPETKVKAETKKEKSWYGLGRRKTAVAKVFLKRGTGKVTINDKEIAALNCLPRVFQSS